MERVKCEGHGMDLRGLQQNYRTASLVLVATVFVPYLLPFPSCDETVKGKQFLFHDVCAWKKGGKEEEQPHCFFWDV